MDDFEGWYLAEHPRIWSTCAALCGDLDAAAEATDEAFVRALERWAKVAAMGSPGGWVQVVALNQLRRSLRRRSRERRLPLVGRPGTTPAVLPDVDLWAAVAGLPSRQRAAIVLRYVHDLAEADIARVMGISRGTVASTLSAAHANLRYHFHEPLVDEETTDKESSR